MIKSYKDLEVWKLSISLVKDIYTVTQRFPHEETYGLKSQMRRAAVSIPSNVSEGKARQGKKEYIHFLYMAKSSCAELETQFVIAEELGFVKDESGKHLHEKLDHVSRMLMNLIKGLKK